MKDLTAGQKLRKYLQLSLKRQREGHRSLIEQLAQMAIVSARAGHGPGFYHLAGFWRRSIPLRDMLGHLDARGYQKRLQELNPEAYRKLSQNKLAEKGILTLLGFPVTRLLGHFHPLHGRSRNGGSLKCAADLTRLLEHEGVGGICFKPLEGWAGRGFEAVDVVSDERGMRFRRLGGDQELMTIDNFLNGWSEGSEAVIEEYLDQHPVLSEMNPASVNTYRIWVLRGHDGISRTLFGYLRIGRGGAIVDNQSSGGIVAPIDLETGIAGCAIDGLPTRETYPVHPDHGATIEGRRLPCWPEAKSLAEDCVAAFPELRFAGLDIAIGVHGPVVIEMNVFPDREGAAFVDMPSATILAG